MNDSAASAGPSPRAKAGHFKVVEDLGVVDPKEAWQ